MDILTYKTLDFNVVLDSIASEHERHQSLDNVALLRFSSAKQLFEDMGFQNHMRVCWPSFAVKINSLYTQNGKIMQEVGKMREMAIIYLIDRFLGEQIDYRPIDDNVDAAEKGKDWYMFGKSVSCKTVSCSKSGSFSNIKISWIEDKVMAKEFQANWLPEHDLLLCRIKWGSDDEGFYYISKEIQTEIVLEMGHNKAIKTSDGYSKGTSLTKVACDALIKHPDTLSLKMPMPINNHTVDLRNQIFDNWYLKCSEICN